MIDERADVERASILACRPARTPLFEGEGTAARCSAPATCSRLALLVVVGVSLAQVGFSLLWLRHFRFGPLEWAWRSLTYWQRQPFRRGPGGE